MLNIIRNIALIFGFLFSIFPAVILAQQGTGDSCNINRLFLGDVGILFRTAFFNPKETKYTSDMKIIIIASLGAKETDRKYNVQRSDEVKKYFTREQGIPDNFVILAQGEKRKDKGAVEIYYGGILQYDITFKPKQKLILEEGKDPCIY